MTPSSRRVLTIAANQGEMGGGEVMLLNIARAARELGNDVQVVGPAHPAELIATARAEGFSCVEIPGDSTRRYLANLRRWDKREREGLLWCNGLRPAFATAGHRGRIVHLHQEPLGRLRTIARLARLGAVATVVPSRFMSSRVPDSFVLENWTQPLPRVGAADPLSQPVRIGYLGRLSSDKGVPDLAHAVSLLLAGGHDVRLVLAGASRFVDADDEALVKRSLDALGSNVEKLGWVTPSEFFEAVDLAVFPSTWDEPFGLVVAEAMSSRCPFVITDAGALPEVSGAEHPFIASRADPSDLADVIHKAIGTTLWPELTEQAYERWAAHFSPSAGALRLAHLLHALHLDCGSES